mmetsp:Transcript_20293/g.47707  ORF Transcript_20293/g.47707 Transcript_20293/m.47707 type:complete len:108 (-) Transcript_20293:86-409(-)
MMRGRTSGAASSRFDSAAAGANSVVSARWRRRTRKERWVHMSRDGRKLCFFKKTFEFRSRMNHDPYDVRFGMQQKLIYEQRVNGNPSSSRSSGSSSTEEMQKCCAGL